MTVPRQALAIGVTFALLATTALMTYAQQSANPAKPTGPKAPQFLAVDVAPPGTAALKTLYNFAGGSGGAGPYAGVVIGKGGVLYGTTDYGGSGSCNNGGGGAPQAAPPGCGTVFSLTPPASKGASWTETLLYTFTGTDGGNPYAGLVISSGGVLYGTTNQGVTSPACANGCGTVFSLKP